jgi:predicted dithiol-disulfide oxidoreductase (DUF899 family)
MHGYVDPEIERLATQLSDARNRLVQALRQRGGAFDPSYEFSEGDRKNVSLHDLFLDRSDLLVIHNMGRRCRYCTLWADGINGILKHLESRTSVVLVSPDPPTIQRLFAQERGWNIRMVQDASGRFTDDLKFSSIENGERYLLPGVSSFHRQLDGTIIHVASDGFGPGDVYMPLFPLFDLLLDGPAGWQPQYSYSRPVSIDIPR